MTEELKPYRNSIKNNPQKEAVKKAGFKTVRIPVTWAPHLGDAPDYKIDEDWLARVKQIVNWVLECDMYAVINVHHDDAFWLVTNKENDTATRIGK